MCVREEGGHTDPSTRAYPPDNQANSLDTFSRTGSQRPQYFFKVSTSAPLQCGLHLQRMNLGGHSPTIAPLPAPNLAEISPEVWGYLF